MKKVLLGTSALALVGAYSTTASAVEWDVKVGGYFEAFAAYADSDVDNIGSGADFGGVDSKRDVEIHFKPSITLDNGIKIGADVQLEGSSGTADYIDEAYLFVRGSFGEVLLGSENSAGYKMTYGAPDVSMLNVNSGSLTAFVPFSGAVSNTDGAGVTRTVAVGADTFRGTLGSTFIENGRNNDAERFTYFTPRFGGVQLGVSYARDGNQDSNAQLNLNNTVLQNIVDFGANYVQSFGPVDIAVSGRYGVAFGDGNSNPTIWSTGVNIGFFGVTIGGSFAEQNNSRGNPAGVVGADVDDGRAFDAGVSYETGPWGVSFTYFNGENVNEESSTAIGRNDEKMQAYLLAMKYKLAKGVDLHAYGAYVDFEEEIGDATLNGDDVDGFIIGTGIKISF